MFKADRVFSQRSVHTGQVEWYVSLREGEMGPYPSKETARLSLSRFIRHSVAAGDDGGRSGEIDFRLELVPIEEGIPGVAG